MDQQAAYLFFEGTNVESYRLLGSFLKEPVETEELNSTWIFRVWAPKAESVSVLGDFNGWNPICHPMERYDGSDIWVTEVQGASEGQFYKYAITGRDGETRLKADPYARSQELRPGTASRLYQPKDFAWSDAEFLQARPPARESQPLNIYECHLASWERTEEDRENYGKERSDGELSYWELADRIAPYLQGMGYNAIEIMPITEYPYDGSWGYQVTGYFAPTARFGEPEGFKYFVNTMHEHGIRVILDWVPAHFPRDGFGLYHFDGTAQYEYEDPRLGEHKEWGTMVFDYAKAEVRSFLLSSAWFWAHEYHVDGLRVDAVSSMIYLDYGRQDFVRNRHGGNENLEAIAFLKDLNYRMSEADPAFLLCAEESTAFPYLTTPVKDGGVGFTHKWNMGWMHDTLNYFEHDYPGRHLAHNGMTFSMTYAFSENYILALSHDEVVHGKRSLVNKMPGDLWQKFASLRNLFAWQMGHPGAKLQFMGAEIPQFIEWRYKEALEWFLLDIDHHGMHHDYMRFLNHLYLEEASLHECDDHWEGFKWHVVDDTRNEVYVFSRHARDPEDCLVFVLNMIPQELKRYRFNVPYAGDYALVLNSDEARWYGSDNWCLNHYEPSLRTGPDPDKLVEDSLEDHDFTELKHKLQEARSSLDGDVEHYLEVYDEVQKSSGLNFHDRLDRTRVESHLEMLKDSLPSDLDFKKEPYLELDLPPLACLILRYVVKDADALVEQGQEDSPKKQVVTNKEKPSDA